MREKNDLEKGRAAGAGVIREGGRTTVGGREKKQEVTEAEKKSQGQNSVCGWL